jgi:3-keto-disaccharide hydrolase
LIGGVTIKVNGERSVPDSFTRVQKRIDAEMPAGEWNRIEIIANKGKITYIVNGKIVNEGEDPTVNHGKILVQSEGAEIYYRKIEIEELN